jgi:CofD-related protein of GAK system
MRVVRDVSLPDPLRVERCRRVPELGPRILFFSGGTALRELSRRLKLLTHNSVHVITPFDSGGSSAHLRRAFGMPSVGDIRSRLMALADETVKGDPEMYRLFHHRLAANGDPLVLGGELRDMIAGEHPLIADVQRPLRRLVRTQLRSFAKRMEPGFDLRGASIGNLMLAGGYLSNDRDLDAVIFLFSKLVAVRGTVHPVVDDDFHLEATLAGGTRVRGQHNLTGKEVPPLTEAIRSLRLVRDQGDGEEVRPPAHEKVLSAIRQADLLVYPMGSFWTSVLANLLPAGVGRAIVETTCPKVYIPNTGADPEQQGMSGPDAVRALAAVVRRDAGEDAPLDRILSAVLLDRNEAPYACPQERGGLRGLDLQVLEADLIRSESFPELAADSLADILVSLC